MPMPPFESRSVGLPEVPMVPPGWTKFDYQNPAETFLSAYQMMTNINAKKQRLTDELSRLALQNKALEMRGDQNDAMNSLKLKGLENSATANETRFAIQQQRADQEAERYRNLYEVGTEANRVKDERTKLYAEKTAATLADQSEKTLRERQKNFQAEAGNVPGGLGLPADAFENTGVTKGEGTGWHTDPNKPGHRFYRKMLTDQNGVPIKDPATGKPYHDVTVHDATFNRLKGTYDDLKSGGPTSRQVNTPPDAPGTTWVRDPETGKLVPQ